jgi:HK97 family phage prohead protease
MKNDVFASIDAFRAAAREKPEIADARVRASFDTEVKAGDGERSLTFTISTASVDRMGDTIAVNGWQLDQFRKNPVVLWAHDSSSLPVAKAPKIWIEADKLKANAEFTPKGMAKFNDTVFEMYKGGFLSATSVGFAPMKYAFTEDPQRRHGIDFLEQELLEFSAVPVPANAEALIEGRSAGIDIAPVLDWCELAIKRAGDNSRVVNLVENVLGSKGDDPVILAWAKRVAVASGQSLILADRLTAINALAEEFRSDAKKASSAKGASGIYRRCANRIEKAITGEERADNAPSQVQVSAAAGFAEMAARRLKTIRYTGL